MSCAVHLLLPRWDLHAWRSLALRCRQIGTFGSLRSGRPISRSLQESFRILQLSGDGRSSPAQVKDAYLRLAKIYHPDSGAPTADAALFAQVEEAYRAVLTHQSKARQPDGGAEEDEEEEKTRGVALQHRHYLSYEGVGLGPPSQRERQYRQIRVDRASEQVLSYRQREHERASAADGALVERDVRQRSRKIKITQAVERLVEDLIQESMARGDFKNLSGAGKPLSKFQHNPYADPMTHNLNRILIDNGYQPPWVLMQRDIREAAAQVRARLLEGRARLGEPMAPAEQNQWEELCSSVQEELKALNKMVDNYNLIVPMLSMQMVHYSLSREAARAASRAQQLRVDQQRRREEERRQRKEEKKRVDSERKEEKKRQDSERKNMSRRHRVMAWMQRLLQN